MIVITNNLNFIKTLTTESILNLSTQVLPQENIIDISQKVFFYKEQLENDYLKNLTQLNGLYSDDLFYNFSDLGWNSYFKNDPFILIIYYFIFLDYIKDKELRYIYIESTVLIEFIRVNQPALQIQYKHTQNIQQRLKANLRPYFYILKLFISKIKYTKSKIDYSNAQILFYSFPLKRCFSKNNEWEDVFFNDLYDEIKQVEKNTYRFAPLEPNSFHNELFERREYIISLINYFQLSDIPKILFNNNRILNKKNTLKLKMKDIDFTFFYTLFLKEYQQSKDFYVRYSFHLLFKKLIIAVKPKLVIYPYENQPWEKSINIISNEFNIKTMAIQHSLLCKDMFYLYNKGLSQNTLPTTFIANGEYGRKVIDFMNNNVSITTIGTKRHSYKYTVDNIRKTSNINNIAIMLSNLYEIKDIINCFNKNFEKLTRYTVYFKPPPEPYESAIYAQYLSIKNTIKFKHEFLIGKNLEQVFDFCETVVFLSTTVGLEAYIKNKITIRYSTSTNYDLNLTEDIKDGIYFAKYYNFFDILNTAISENLDNQKIDIQYFFQPWDKEKFKNILLETLGEQSINTSF